MSHRFQIPFSLLEGLAVVAVLAGVGSVIYFAVKKNQEKKKDDSDKSLQ